MARDIYTGGKQFSNVYELKLPFKRAGTILNEEIIKKLVNSMNNRIFEVIAAKGKQIKY